MWQPELRADVRPLYMAIARAIELDIAQGRLRPGERLPTQRELARELALATGTVTRAYAEAEKRGLVRGEVGRGTFVGPPRAERLSLGTPDLTSPRVVELSVDLPVHAEDPDLAGVLRRLAERGDLSDLLRYHAHGGTPRHRSAGVEWVRRCGVAAERERVLVVAGTQQALTISLMVAAEPGDWVFTDELTYPGLRSVAEHLHLRVQGVPGDEQGIDPDALDAACRQRRARALYVMPTFHNPTTACLSESRRAALAAVAREHELWILEDDVHRFLADASPTPLAQLAPERTYYFASLSKAVTGGLRVGYLVAPAGAVERLAQAIWATSWMVPSLNAEIAAMWIEDGTADEVVRRKRAEARERQRIAAGWLDATAYRAQEHGFYAWLSLPAPWTSAEFALEARQRGVAVTPASAFSVDRASVPAAVRVCLGAAEDRAQLELGLARLRETLASDPALGPALR